MSGRIVRAVVVAALALTLAGAAAATEESSPARLTFVKVFPGSNPEYIRITVEETGDAIYQGGAADRPDAPDSFKLSPATVARLFGVAAELNYFRGNGLESGHRVAFMGKKTFLYEKGDMREEATYNHTRSSAAQELQLWFERLARSRSLIARLQHRLVFDRLGLLETLRELERDFNAGQVPEPEQFIPVLEQLANDSRLMQLARTRAQSLLRRIRSGAAILQIEYGDLQSGLYYKVVVVEWGGATQEVRRFNEPAKPQPLDLPQEVLGRLWELVQLENYFRELDEPHEAGPRLGGYRLTYEAGPEQRRLVFASPPSAATAEIVRIFQQAITQEQFRQRLRAALDTKSMQLQLILQELDAAVLGRNLIAPREFLPLLEDIAGQGSQHPVVRGLAERLLVRIREANP